MQENLDSRLEDKAELVSDDKDVIKTEEVKDETTNEERYAETPGVKVLIQPQRVVYVPFGYSPEAFEERTSLRKNGLSIGLTLLIMMAISFAWSFIYVFVMKLCGFSSSQAIQIIRNPALLQVIQIVLSTLMFTFPFVILSKCRNERVSDLVSYQKPKKGLSSPLFLFGIAFCAIANIAISQLATFFESIGINYNYDTGENPSGIFGFLLVVISTAVIPPLVEEFAFRGVILGLLRKHGDGFAIIVSSLLFGLMHGNFQQIPFAFLVGLVLSYIVVKSGSLWIAVAVHAFNNFLSLMMDYLSKIIPSQTINMIYTIVMVLCLILGIFAMFLLSNRDEAYHIVKKEGKVTTRQSVKWFFSSPAIIIFIIASIAESLQFFI